MPWFVYYVAWEVLAGFATLPFWFLGRQLYERVFWWIEPVEIALIVAAVRESCLRVFEGVKGFRSGVWAVIGAVIIYSAWEAFHAPPIHANRFGVFEVQAEFLFRWAILGISMLIIVLGGLLGVPTNTRENAVVIGFGIICGSFLLYIGIFWIFGNKYTFLAQYVPSVGYFVAVGWWIWVFSRPIEEYGFKELGLGPKDIAGRLRSYRQHAKEMTRKKS